MVNLYCDGGYRLYYKVGAYCWVVVVDKVEVASEAGLMLNSTNNVCEYTGLIEGLRGVKRLGYTTVHVISDSQLVIKQMKGSWKVNNERLIEMRRTAISECDGLDVTFEWKRRCDQWITKCDKRCNYEMDKHLGMLIG
jgi:ribonuclease HI